MAAKKEKGGIDALRVDVQALAEAFWSFRDAMLTDVAVQQAEQQQTAETAVGAGGWVTPDETQVHSSAALLAALAQPQRLRMAILLAGAPASVAELVEALELKTSGAAYHHLNVLINAGVALQPERGTFAISPDAAPQINSILVALFGSAEIEEPKKKKKK